MTTDERVTGEGMARLGFVVGRWAGSGRHRSGDGSWARLHQTEDVRLALGGALLVVEGCGRHPDGTLVHQAFAIASYEPDLRHYRWEAFTPGRRVESELQVSANGFAWSIVLGPETAMVYRVTIDADTWTETGSIVRGCEPVHETVPVLELTLHRVGAAPRVPD